LNQIVYRTINVLLSSTTNVIYSCHFIETDTEQTRTEHNFYWSEIHIQRIVTKTTH